MWRNKPIQQLKKHLKDYLQHPAKTPSLSMKEKALINRIRVVTQNENRNNVTRTMAYLNFYLKNREIHWALLAHLVSRNAGWNMTDLKGEFLPRLITGKEQIDFFVFLERGNWLIFQDAYPQLLLYAESKKAGTPLFHLLPAIGVSSFMIPNWKHFWEHQSSSLLTTALIINEQNYIENRVVHNSLYKDTVVETLSFKLQDLFDMNQILFPFDEKKTKLVGDTVHHFSSLHDRISIGIVLYKLLFSEKLEAIVSWAGDHPHTGSRKDYWPEVFNDVKETLPGESAEKPCKMGAGAPRIFSPTLEKAWEDWTHQSAKPGDWFKDMKVFPYFKKDGKGHTGDIEEHYCDTIEKLEFAVFTKKVFFRRE
ncbi:DUF2515 domain-containing protein [Halobacillus yeomjeoni]|uniref:DUF2515 domain-containing protein n=1 Tax=Halobacillus yeomjeoni TaxID=311194 RepID=UPI001CD4C30C|nr:DUF2515 domain-containing protein [Halobacillus yeomjeoni]MCA0982844.1 DUF2515 domain-containing protein [Halobacillus yeomjeoni]